LSLSQLLGNFRSLCLSGAHYPNSPQNEGVLEICVHILDSYPGESKKTPQLKLLPYYSNKKCSQY